jgi:hypothetical protein
VRLGPQKWSTKRYVAHRSITSGWLAFFISLALISFLLLPVFLPNGLLPYQFEPVLVLIMLGIVPVWSLAMQVWLSGFAALPYTRKGVVRDIDRHVFLGQLGEEGSVCPLCHARLRFDNPGSPPILRCTRNSDHRWAFDFTAVID